MNMPQVLIFARNEFQRRLMTDLVACNEMRVIATDRVDRVDQVESGVFRADVVVIDGSMGAHDVKSVIGRLRALPAARRPRILGISCAGESSRDFQVQEQLAWPLDIGDFARRVKDEAQAQVLTLEV